MANLNGKQIVEQGIITNVDNPECIQQVGVDLELIAVSFVAGVGIVPAQGKTQLSEYKDVSLSPNPAQSVSSDIEPNMGWYLTSGAYNIVLKQGCKIPSNQRLQIVQRSSLLRNGSILASSMFDPGFETDNIGTVLIVTAPLFIEQNARVAQAYTTEVNVVSEENLYSGQWQGDAQRDSVSNS